MVMVAVGQICSTSSMTHNLHQCRYLIKNAVEAGAKVLFLPEASDYIASTPAESISLCQPATTSPFVQGLQKAAHEHSLSISVGIHEPTIPTSPRIRNTLVWIDAHGTIAHRYQKLHLMTLDLTRRPGGGPKIHEADTTEPGPRIEEPYVPHAEIGEVGSLICYDLRFPEPALTLRRRGAKTIVYPSAFTVPTGKLVWESLLRARAIETQCWVIAAAQCGRHNPQRVSYGGSIVIDPWGRVVGRVDKVEDEEQEEDGRQPLLLCVEVDLGMVEQVRGEMELVRRTDVYPQI